MSDAPVYLSTKNAAARLGIGKSTLEQMRVKGTGPAFVRASVRRVVYRLSDLDAYSAARTARSTSERMPA